MTPPLDFQTLESVCGESDALALGIYRAYVENPVAFAYDFSVDYIRYLGQLHGRDALAYRDWLRSELLGGCL